MEKLVKINYKNQIIKEFPKDTEVSVIAKEFQKDYMYDILIARVDNRFMELSDTISKDCDIDFYDRSSKIGNDVYDRSIQFVLVLAVKRLFGKNAEILIEHSMDKGIYCELPDIETNKKVVQQLEEEMKKIVAEDLIFTKMSVSRIDAISFFEKKKRFDKSESLRYISNTYINLYRLDDVYDYFYGEMAYSTKSINSFALTYIAGNGFVVSFPNATNPEVTLPYTHHQMLFDKFLDYTKWGRIINIKNITDLNKVTMVGRYNDLIQLAESHYDSQLALIADQIYEESDHVKLVLCAGASSSGKTTTASKLGLYLRSKGLRPHLISLDNYFKNRKDTPVLPNGELDLESLDAVDVNLFNKHLIQLLDGEKVLLPEYNFIKGEREYHNNWLKIEKNDVIVIEGLHCLNDELTLSIERRRKFKIYISPLTQINIDNHNRIHTTDIRKLRRIVRDNRHRGYNAGATLKHWEEIRKGEEKYIFPFQDDIDVVFNTALLYEIAVLKTYVEPLLYSVSEEDEMYYEAIRLINLLREVLPMPSEGVPRDSVLREFIGDIRYIQEWER